MGSTISSSLSSNERFSADIYDFNTNTSTSASESLENEPEEEYTSPLPEEPYRSSELGSKLPLYSTPSVKWVDPPPFQATVGVSIHGGGDEVFFPLYFFMN